MSYLHEAVDRILTQEMGYGEQAVDQAAPEREDTRTMAKFVVRLPGDLRDRVQNAARDNFQSMNSFVVETLEKSLAAPATPMIPWAPGMLCKVQGEYYVVLSITVDENGLPGVKVQNPHRTLDCLYFILERP